jgi:leader peptidase (prepilin peptidase)/N-methyltransferase
MADQLIYLALAFAVGAAVGSFLNVCIARWPHEQSVVSPPSRCPNCGHGIRWYENVPIFGWLRLRGRCAGCRQPISPRYPLVELTVALLWVACAWWIGPTLTGLRVAILATTLLGIALTDLEHYLIPDGFTVFGFLFLLASSLVAAMVGDHGPFATPWDAVIGACVGAGAIAIIGWLGEVALKKEAMGLGDVTLMAMAGAALGPTRTLLSIFVGAALASIVFVAVVYPLVALRRRTVVATTAVATIAPAVPAVPGTPGETVVTTASSSTEQATSGTEEEEESGVPLVPFGVFLAPATLVTLLWGDALVGWYLGLLR